MGWQFGAGRLQDDLHDCARPWCGADAGSEFDRSDYGMSYGKQLGFRMRVRLRIQVEAARQGAP